MSDDNENVFFGRRIAMRRREKGYTQAQLGEMVGIGDRHISNLERGKGNCSHQVLLRLCDALEVSPDFLLYGKLHENHIRKDAMDMLRLCAEEDIPLIMEIIELFVKKNRKKDP